MLNDVICLYMHRKHEHVELQSMDCGTITSFQCFPAFSVKVGNEVTTASHARWLAPLTNGYSGNWCMLYVLIVDDHFQLPSEVLLDHSMGLGDHLYHVWGAEYEISFGVGSVGCFVLWIIVN